MTRDREYFTWENPMYGYRQGFRDFVIHFATADILEKMHPKSILEIGGARGYVAKKLIARGIPVTVMDKSEHCYQTRAIERFIHHDLECTPWDLDQIPWSLPGSEMFDLVFSDSVLEHIHPEKVDDVICEIARAGSRSFHGIALDDGKISREEWASDGTHYTFKTKEWWEQKFRELAPDHEVTISGNITGGVTTIPLPGGKEGEIKLNIGSFIDMFYYGWINLDILPLNDFSGQCLYRYQQCDVRQGLPFEDNSVDAIFSSHFLEHLTKQECDWHLQQCFRVMKPGAYIRVAVPNAAKLTQEYLNNELGYLEAISPGVENSPFCADKLWEILMAGEHKQIFDARNLINRLRRAGFVGADVASPFHSRCKVIEDETIVSYPDISLVVDARKSIKEGV